MNEGRVAKPEDEIGEARHRQRCSQHQRVGRDQRCHGMAKWASMLPVRVGIDDFRGMYGRVAYLYGEPYQAKASEEEGQALGFEALSPEHFPPACQPSARSHQVFPVRRGQLQGTEGKGPPSGL
jgi:hypothetical protein